MDELLIPIIGNLKDDGLPTSEEYHYWRNYESRIFFIDYDIDNYLLELGKIIIDINKRDMDKPKEELRPITIFISSNGGDLSACYSLCALIMTSRTKVRTVNMGNCYSAGLLLLLAGHERYAFKMSNALIHQGSGGMSGSFTEIQEAQKNYEKQVKQMREYILSRTNISEELFKENETKDWYISDNEQVEYGIVTKLIDDISEVL